MALDLSRLNEIDFKNLGTLPIPIRAAMIGALCVLVAALGYVFHIQGQLSNLSAAAAKEVQLKKDFEDKQNKAANLDTYKRQMKDMEDAFGTMLRQLPGKTEVADLLVDITQTGLANGLTFEVVRPETEKPQEFYAELPISLQVSGNYHDFGGFVSGVASLPRIVTLHDISIGREGKNQKLTMKATAKTYRYLDPQELAAAAAERAKAKKKGK